MLFRTVLMGDPVSNSPLSALEVSKHLGRFRVSSPPICPIGLDLAFREVPLAELSGVMDENTYRRCLVSEVPEEEVDVMVSEPVEVSSEKTPQERKELLARTIQGQVASGGRIESQSDFQAVIVKGKPVNNVLQLILTIVTIGFWGIVWLALLLFGGEKRSMVTVDEFGNVSVQKI